MHVQTHLMDKYTIKKFQPADANTILSYGEVEDFRDEFATQQLMCEDSWTGFYLGDPIVCGGIYPLWNGVAEVWIIMKQGMNRHKFFMLKNIKIKLEDTIQKNNYHRIQAGVACDFTAGQQFAEWFGLVKESTMYKYGPDKKNYYRYVRII